METAWIIDDDEIYKYGFSKFVAMKFDWWQIIGFNHPKAAIEMLTAPQCVAQLPDIIFLNSDISGMNGWEFINAYNSIKPQLNKQIAIIMVTSSINYIDSVRAQNCNDITLYMSKPLNYQQFSTAFSAGQSKLTNSYLAQANRAHGPLH